MLFFLIIARTGVPASVEKVLTTVWFVQYTVISIVFIPLERLVSRFCVENEMNIRQVFNYLKQRRHLSLVSTSITLLFLPLSLYLRSESFGLPSIFVCSLFTTISFFSLHVLRGWLSGRGFFRVLQNNLVYEAVFRILVAFIVPVLLPIWPTSVLFLIPVASFTSFVLTTLISWNKTEPNRTSNYRSYIHGKNEFSNKEWLLLSIAAICGSLLANSGPLLQMSLGGASDTILIEITYLTVLTRPFYFLMQPLQVVLLPRFSRSLLVSRECLRQQWLRWTQSLVLLSGFSNLVLILGGGTAAEVLFGVEPSRLNLGVAGFTLTCFMVGIPSSLALVAARLTGVVTRASGIALMAFICSFLVLDSANLGNSLLILATSSVTQLGLLLVSCSKRL